jgi:hypothetical protein
MVTITIPKELTKKGELVIIPRKEYEEFLRISKIIPKDQEWFWTKEWQGKEKEATRDIGLKNVSVPYKTKKELRVALNKLCF